MRLHRRPGTRAQRAQAAAGHAAARRGGRGGRRGSAGRADEVLGPEQTGPFALMAGPGRDSSPGGTPRGGGGWGRERMAAMGRGGRACALFGGEVARRRGGDAEQGGSRGPAGGAFVAGRAEGRTWGTAGSSAWHARGPLLHPWRWLGDIGYGVDASGVHELQQAPVDPRGKTGPFVYERCVELNG